ncbi:MAG: hypothetical protein HYS08_02700 [Chlamydiae bacterium]|nr:hypothetical protein [Chlamydiota bacterium]MBI3266640.1 hypothetical protein [Chlamydiota bacterium]
MNSYVEFDKGRPHRLNMMNFFEKLLVDLVKANVQFITVGGIACAFNGLVRTTEDVDILINGASENVERFFLFLKSFSPSGFQELSIQDFKEEEGAIRIIEDFPLDVFVKMSGFSYQDLAKYIRKYILEGFDIPYLDREGLVLLKSQSLREVDRSDVFRLKTLPPDPSKKNSS